MVRIFVVCNFSYLETVDILLQIKDMYVCVCMFFISQTINLKLESTLARLSSHNGGLTVKTTDRC